jgi:hypothetical protein
MDVLPSAIQVPNRGEDMSPSTSAMSRFIEMTNPLIRCVMPAVALHLSDDLEAE